MTGTSPPQRSCKRAPTFQQAKQGQRQGLLSSLLALASRVLICESFQPLNEGRTRRQPLEEGVHEARVAQVEQPGHQPCWGGEGERLTPWISLVGGSATSLLIPTEEENPCSSRLDAGPRCLPSLDVVGWQTLQFPPGCRPREGTRVVAAIPGGRPSPFLRRFLSAMGPQRT